jgi:hypothetical protein
MENFVPSVSEALRNLHQQAHAAIFERATWPANPSRCDAIERMLINSGLLRESRLAQADPRLTGESILLLCIGKLDPELVHVQTPNEEEAA